LLGTIAAVIGTPIAFAAAATIMASLWPSCPLFRTFKQETIHECNR
jgi:hypothetical protein